MSLREREWHPGGRPVEGPRFDSWLARLVAVGNSRFLEPKFGNCGHYVVLTAQKVQRSRLVRLGNFNLQHKNVFILTSNTESY